MIEQSGDDRIRIESVAKQLGVSPFRLQRTFRRLVGISPGAYAQSIRMRRFKKRLREGSDVTSALYEAGYGSSSRLYERSNGHLGMTPATYGRGGQGMELGCTIAPTPLGRVLVAGTVKGISAIYLGDSEERLEATLRREYPAATISKNPAQVSQWVRQLVGHLSGEQPELDLPLERSARGGTRLRHESRRDFDSLPSYCARGRRPRGIPLGAQAQTGAARRRNENAVRRLSRRA
jgi:AraC family transcriptional regulator of adaptative response/methylated-DNA-[protein]-cysteine methyltransferase